jgi:hypothetical protein
MIISVKSVVDPLRYFPPRGKAARSISLLSGYWLIRKSQNW